MSTSILAAEVRTPPRTAAVLFGGCAALAVIIAACLLAGFTPIAFSIATVFLFAGPHNWFEALLYDADAAASGEIENVLFDWPGRRAAAYGGDDRLSNGRRCDGRRA